MSAEMHGPFPGFIYESGDGYTIVYKVTENFVRIIFAIEKDEERDVISFGMSFHEAGKLIEMLEKLGVKSAKK